MTQSNKPSQSARTIEILLVEDDDDDVRLAQKAFNNDSYLNRIHRVEDGIQAMQFLRREGEFSNAVRPDLVLLDLNMPRKSGREVLKEVKEDPQLRRIPVIVMTTSDDQNDVCLSYEFHANSYVTKPVDLLRFRNTLKTLQDYWFGIVQLPPA